MDAGALADTGNSGQLLSAWKMNIHKKPEAKAPD